MLSKELENLVHNGNAVLVDELLDLIMERKRQLYPEWEIHYVAVERKPGHEERAREKWLAACKLLMEP